MSKLALALLLTAFAATSFPRTSGATNYHEYKKFNLSAAPETMPSRCHVNLKQRWRHHHRDKWWEFQQHD